MSRCRLSPRICTPTAADAIWVVNAYQLAVLVSLLPFASFGDIFGYRRVYRFGLVLYTAATLISATAGSLEMLILGRGLAGARRRRADERQHRAGALHLSAPSARARASAWCRWSSRYRRHRGRASPARSWRSRPGPGCSRSTCRSAIVTFILAMRLLPYTKPSEHRFDVLERGAVRADVRVSDRRHHRRRARPVGAAAGRPNSPARL